MSFIQCNTERRIDAVTELLLLHVIVDVLVQHSHQNSRFAPEKI